MTADERIVVGVSGSPSSTAALRWAAREARLRAAEILAVHAWSARTEMLAPYASRCGVPSLDQQREASSALLTTAIRCALGSGSEGSGGAVRSILVEGVPIRVLLRYAASADLLVLGRRRLRPNPMGDIALGAVARCCVLHAQCPIVLIADADVVTDAETSARRDSCARQWSSLQHGAPVAC